MKNSKWFKFEDKIPQPYKKIKIDVDGIITETETYTHNKKVYVKLKNNPYFQGQSISLYNQQ